MCGCGVLTVRGLPNTVECLATNLTSDCCNNGVGEL